jgi:putative intracellular protease/amidase
MKQKRILIPLPNYGFDPSEVAIPWKTLSDNGYEIVFASPQGTKAETDTIMLTGKSLGLLKSTLAARQDAVDAYYEMDKSEAFLNPIKYTAVQEKDFDALFLPGGHDKGVREYLESEILQRLVVDLFTAQKPVAAICHGVVLAARSIDTLTGKSVLYHYKTTSLLNSQELLAYNLTRLWLKDYYLTYPGLTVEDEVTSALSDSKNFLKGPSPILRDDKEHLKRGFIVKDRNYISARWPGDVYSICFGFIKMLEAI